MRKEEEKKSGSEENKTEVKGKEKEGEEETERKVQGKKGQKIDEKKG